MRALVIGARGLLGSELVRQAPEGLTIVGGDVRVDVTDAAAIASALDAHRPDWVLNCAAYTHVDQAETEPEVADRINGTAVGLLAAAAAERDVRMLHYGTDYIFAGDQRTPYRENDTPAPIGAYGRSKLLGERALQDSRAEWILVRTQWLFGREGKSFPRTMWQRARSGEPTRVVNDQIGHPTYAVDLAQWTWELVARDARGIYHAANGGAPASWYDVAYAVFERAGAAELLSPCRSSQFPTIARRPAYSVLDTSRLESALETSVPTWRDALGRFLEVLAAEPSPAAASR